MSDSDSLPDAETIANSIRYADVDLQGLTLATCSLIVDPSAPTIVFLHDSLGCIKVWRDFPQRLCLASGCNGLIYDRQGYGDSSSFGKPRAVNYLEEQADVLSALLARLGLVDTILFGHSDGGSIALLTAAKTPEPVRAVISQGAHVFVEEITLEGIRRADELYRTSNLESRLQKHHGLNTKALFRAWVDTWLSPQFRGFNIEGYLSKITCPVLVIQGVNDEYGTERQVDAIVRQVAGTASKALIDNCGHSPHKDAPGVVLELALNFINANRR